MQLITLKLMFISIKIFEKIAYHYRLRFSLDFQVMHFNFASMREHLK